MKKLTSTVGFHTHFGGQCHFGCKFTLSKLRFLLSEKLDISFVSPSNSLLICNSTNSSFTLGIDFVSLPMTDILRFDNLEGDVFEFTSATPLSLELSLLFKNFELPTGLWSLFVCEMSASVSKCKIIIKSMKVNAIYFYSYKKRLTCLFHYEINV